MDEMKCVDCCFMLRISKKLDISQILLSPKRNVLMLPTLQNVHIYIYSNVVTVVLKFRAWAYKLTIPHHPSAHDPPSLSL